MAHSDSHSSSPNQSSSTHASAGDAAQDAKRRTQRTVEQLAGDARRQTTETVDKQKRAAADQFGGLATALHKTAEQLKTQQQTSLAHYANSIAEDVDHLADALRDKDVSMLFDQTQQFARRRPAVFLGGAVATGFMLARFLKSSDTRGRPGATDVSHSGPPSGPYTHSQEPASAARDTHGQADYLAAGTPAASKVEHDEN